MTMTSQQEQPPPSSSPASSAGHIFQGCSPISKYELLEKLGEGTFGLPFLLSQLMKGKYGKHDIMILSNYLH
jgi:hypothetical protein